MMNDVIRKLRPRLLSWLHRSRSGITLFVRRFSYKEVKNATDGFRRRMYGNPDGVSAYKARFRASEEDVLVKDFGPRDGNDDEFYRQVQLLGRLHHRHVLAVKGFSSGRRRFVVFDEIENGSLKEYLDDPLRTPLNWKTRLQVAIGVAAALEYLLLFSNPPMYPVSISSSTIMLDQNFNAKLSDVGLFETIHRYIALNHSTCCRWWCYRIAAREHRVPAGITDAGARNGTVSREREHRLGQVDSRVQI
ncbi:Probable receptor-like protein kinase At1g49730 [Linum perenne]